MAAPVYSHRFVQVQVPGTWAGYTVPGGHRAVVRSIMMSTYQQSDGEAYVSVAGITIARAVFQAGTFTQNVDTRLVAYAGEAIMALTYGVQTRVVVGGYLFVDPASAKGPPPAAQQLPAPPLPPGPHPPHR